jgi:hypothetical protein
VSGGQQARQGVVLASAVDVGSWPVVGWVTHTRAWVAAEHGRSGRCSGVISVSRVPDAQVIAPCASFDEEHQHADYDPGLLWSPREKHEKLPEWVASISPAKGGSVAAAAVPHSGDGPLIAGPGAGMDEVHLAVDSLESWAQSQECAGAAFLAVPTGGELAGLLGERGYREIRSEPWALMDDVPTTYDQWLQGLSRGRRRTAKAERRQAGEAVWFRITEGDGLDDESGRILADHYAKFGHRRDLGRVMDLFSRLRASHGSGLRVILAESRPSRERVGFAVMVMGRGNAHHRLVAAVDLPGLHFSLLFYEPISLACRTGIARIDYGTTSYEGKLLRGCSLRELSTLARPFGS